MIANDNRRRVMRPSLSGRRAPATGLVWIVIAAAAAAQVEVGARHPTVTLPSIEGRLQSLPEHEGKKLLVFNFASW